MYVKLGDLAKGRHLFELRKSKDASTWTALIAAYARKGQGLEALECFEWMLSDGVSPTAITYSCILKACGSIRAADKGEKIHNEIAKRGLLEDNLVLGNGLVNMYAKCGALTKARQVLEGLRVRDVISWNALIAGYIDHGEGEQAFKCFDQMLSEGLSPDVITYTSILKACGSMRETGKGEKIHDEISKRGMLGNDIILSTALVDMHVKCGNLVKARQVLEELSIRDAVSWTTLIVGYAEHGKGEHALSCFEQMQCEGFSPDAVTYTSVLKACGCVRALDKGRKVHNEIAKHGLLDNNLVLGNAVVSMYVKCLALAKAQQVLSELSVRDAISWNTIITGYAEHSEGQKALNCFKQMQQEGFSPDIVTFISILKACSNLLAVHIGERVYNVAANQGLLRTHDVFAAALVDMYVQCGDIPKAQRVIKECRVGSVATWNLVISGCAEHGDGELALVCFEQMQREGFSANAVTLVAALKACGSMGAIDKGEMIYDKVSKQGLLENDIVFGTAVVNMYAKCGALAKARLVLEELPIWDVISWTALIAGYAENGECEQVLNCFEEMQCMGLSPNAATFSCILNACSQSGGLDDARMYLSCMSKKYSMKPDIEHYTCMVDIFGRLGHLESAVGVLEKMSSFDKGVWLALLAACQKWGDVEVARWAFDSAVQFDKSHSAFYLFMANIYASAGRRKDAESIEAMRRENNACKS